MKIFLNRIEMEIDDNVTLQQLLESNRLSAPGVAVAVNNRVVKRADWPVFMLTEGMTVTVIKAVCGG